MIRDEVIQGNVGITPVVDKMREARLRWFKHVKKCVNAPIRISEELVVTRVQRKVDVD